MTDAAISASRRRMLEDMTIRRFKASPQHTYVRSVKDFSIFFGRSPNKAAFEDVRRYQLHLISRGCLAMQHQCHDDGTAVLLSGHPSTIRHCQAYPAGPATAEATRDPESRRGGAPIGGRADPKYKAALAVAYGAGLQISEMVSLKVSDIDSKRTLTLLARRSPSMLGLE